jgi:hypothetical protein
MTTDAIPSLLAGPILRKTTSQEINLWLATRSPCSVQLQLHTQNEDHSYQLNPGQDGYTDLRVGKHLHIILLHFELSTQLPINEFIDYNLLLLAHDQSDLNWQPLKQLAPLLVHAQQPLPRFQIKPKVDSILHGSCRKPHHPGTDGLAQADELLANLQSGQPSNDTQWPSLLLMSGDQIYADDVAGPMLQAMHQLSDMLGIYKEQLPGLANLAIATSNDLYQHPKNYYQRHTLLPKDSKKSVIEALFGGAEKPVFTSVNAHNHLISLGEYILMYLLVWSPTPWQLVHLSTPAGLSPEDRQRYNTEKLAIEEFVTLLPAAARTLAHLPCAMIFDDHDISDDWNLNLAWEQAVDNNPLSKRMIGNGLMAYCITQGWGNAPDKFSSTMLNNIKQSLQQPGSEQHDSCIDELMRFQGWDFDWDYQPALVVLDTRTRRWRSEGNANQPSGLLDWEALVELQQRLQGKDAVMLASAAPIFGVKLIEVIQRIFTFFGKPLTVDAENWMSHPGTAKGILDIFRHPETPQNFTVLSGDVHYSFVYDVALRGHAEGPHVWQVCSSGIRNSFPDKLLTTFDFLNRWLFSPRSPLNGFTRRRNMRITPRKPDHRRSGQRLLNAEGIGLIEFDEQGRPKSIQQLTSAPYSIAFERVEAASSWE